MADPGGGASGDTEVEGYLAAPSEGAGLGVIVLAGEDGAGGSVKAFCDRLAAEGFTALAAAVPAGEGLSLETAVDRLQAHPAVRGHGVGVVGFGRGGAAALALAAARPDVVKAAVPFYSVAGPGPVPDWTRVEAAVEGHFAGDPEDGAQEAGSLEATLASSGIDVRMFHYPGTEVGFFDEHRDDVYDEEAARQAWVRTLEFLRAKLG